MKPFLPVLCCDRLQLLYGACFIISKLISVTGKRPFKGGIRRFDYRPVAGATAQIATKVVLDGCSLILCVGRGIFCQRKNRHRKTRRAKPAL